MINAVSGVCERLHREANAQAVLLVGRDGSPLGRAGEPLAPEALSSVIGHKVPTAELLESKEWHGPAADGARTVLLMLVGQRAILVVLFADAATLAIVRMRAREASDELALLFERAPGGGATN